MTGGLQEQITDGEKHFGIGIEPTSKAIIGSQDVPYIYEDRISKEDFLDAMESFYDMTDEERKQLGSDGRKYVLSKYGMDKYTGLWYQTFKEVFEEFGSWDTRKGYKAWEVFEIQ
jgi:hypothetical protein